MALYSRRQLLLLLGLAAAAVLGLGIGHWRRGHADLVAEIERFDQRAEEPSLDTKEDTAARTATSGAPGVSRGARDVGWPPRGRPPRKGATGPAAADKTRPVDLNHASVDELMTLPGIGPVLAARIVAEREGAGPFASVDDIRRVPGVGPRKLERLRATATVSP